jgi:diguanylate cyclase (GGDEF)-like protein
MAIANLNLRETLRHQSIRDSLTGLYNRRYFQESLEREIRRVKRKGGSLAVMMIDLDRFKLFNDNFGHEAGDTLLRAFADLLRRRVRGEDIPCRYGGEEFALILPEATLEATCARARELCQAVKELQPVYQDIHLGSVTASVGVAVYPEHGPSAEDIVRAADNALYHSKACGRDRVSVAPASPLDRRFMIPE